MDIGCGIGRVLKPLARHFDTLVGVDVSSTMITQSKVWLSGFPQITTFETSGVDLHEFEPHSFNLVYSYVAFQHMPRPIFERYLGEINRVLTPNGYLALQLPIGPYCDVPIEDTVGIRSYPIQEIVQKLRHNGLAFFNETTVHQISTGITQQTIAFTSSRKFIPSHPRKPFTGRNWSIPTTRPPWTVISMRTLPTTV